MLPKTQFGMDVEELNLGLYANYELLRRRRKKTLIFCRFRHTGLKNKQKKTGSKSAGLLYLLPNYRFASVTRGKKFFLQNVCPNLEWKRHQRLKVFN